MQAAIILEFFLPKLRLNKRQLRFHRVKILTFTAGYARKETQVHADMRLVFGKY